MKIVEIDFHQFLAIQLLYQESNTVLYSNLSIFTIFKPKWKNKNSRIRHLIDKLLNHLNQLSTKISCEVVYVIEIDDRISNESIDYVIDELELVDLPSIVIYNNSFNVMYKSIVSENIINDSVLYNILAFNRFPYINNESLSYKMTNLLTNSTSYIGSIYLAGDKSQVGKSSVCLGILSHLLSLGLHPSSIAYIKPVTQCEAEQPIAKYCQRLGVSCRSIGPVVFYKGFTRAFLDNETESPEVLLDQVVQAVREISKDKRFVIVDGVGYPSVGSICSLSNAHVARALNIPVLLVGKSGVGDAVDSYNINSVYFESFGVQVLGGVFNKLSTTGFYNIDNCRQAVSTYFSKFKQGHRLYGFIPNLSDNNDNESKEVVDKVEVFINSFIRLFKSSFDIYSLLFDVIKYELAKHSIEIDNHNNTINSRKTIKQTTNSFSKIKVNNPIMSTLKSEVSDNDSHMISSRKRNRVEIEYEAKLSGAKTS